MNEGWYNGNYWILLNENEIVNISEMYLINKYLPGFRIFGLRGWDDFIVVEENRYYTVPTVPMINKYLEPLDLPIQVPLEIDLARKGKIKWYIKPLIVGGDPGDESNMIYLEMDKHAELVKWWNEQLHGKIA